MVKNIPHRHLTDSTELERSFSENYWQVQEQDIVCVPSLSFDTTEMEKITGTLHYEERQLFNILLLKNPATRLIYVTSVPIDPEIIKYYVSLLPASVSRDGLDKRLICLSTNDASNKPLSAKMLERPLLLNRIKNLIRPNCGILLCFTSTQYECKIASELEIPIFGIHKNELAYWGSKSGSRQIFTEAEIPHPLGVINAKTGDELAEKIVELCNEHPMNKMIVKLNQGFSGQGNALLDLSNIKDKKYTKENVLKALENLEFSCPTETWEKFKPKIELMSAISEEFYEGEDPKCPSVQGCVSMSGDVEILSTHEQVLKGQIYQGCTFPASEEYRRLIQRYGRRVGRLLALKGVRGHFGVDFLVTTKQPKDAENEDANNHTGYYVYALEINLRQCGTTHPYFTMKFLTESVYDKHTGTCHGSKGREKFYTSTDNLHKEEYKGLLPQDVLEIFAARNLIFDYETQTGVTFHMMGALSEHGKVGITCVGDSPAEANALFARVEKEFAQITADRKSTQQPEKVEKLPKKENVVAHVKSDAAQDVCA